MRRMCLLVSLVLPLVSLLSSLVGLVVPLVFLVLSLVGLLLSLVSLVLTGWVLLRAWLVWRGAACDDSGGAALSSELCVLTNSRHLFKLVGL